MDYRTVEEINQCEACEHGLAKVATRSSDAWRLRRDEDSEYRAPFVRDRDKIIHSLAFQRLVHKTQMFCGADPSKYTTRLMHTMKVWQVACTIARALRLNEDLTGAIALGHDIGHAPFGHIGEAILRKHLLQHNGFEHNEEGLLVALYFEEINLTLQTLEGILKHTRFSYEPYLANGVKRVDPFHTIKIHTRPAKEYSGIMGYMGPPRDDQKVTFITEPTYEAQVVDIADEIAYVVHDLEDCTSRGIVEAEELPVEWYREFGSDPKNGIDRLVKGVISANLALLEEADSREGKLKLQHTTNLEALVQRMKKWYDHEVYQYRLASERDEAEKMLNAVLALFSDKPTLLKDYMHPGLYYQIVKCGFAEKERVGHCIAMMTDHDIIKVYRERCI